MQMSFSPPWYLNCFLFDNPIIVWRAVSIGAAVPSWTNHSSKPPNLQPLLQPTPFHPPHLQHFPFDSAIFWQFKVIRRGLGWGRRLIFVFSLIMLIPWKSAFFIPSSSSQSVPTSVWLPLLEIKKTKKTEVVRGPEPLSWITPQNLPLGRRQSDSYLIDTLLIYRRNIYSNLKW